MRNFEKLEQIQENLATLISENAAYFPKDDAEDVAREFIECYRTAKDCHLAPRLPACWMSKLTNFCKLTSKIFRGVPCR